jgi:4-amino-4-deoxy-L-arabinose transferase-like glycosyltransferase
LSVTLGKILGVAGGSAVLLGLALYILAGTPVATFHPDEAMQIHASGDWEVLTGPQGPWALTTRPPYPVDSEAHLRILNGSLHRYAIGLLRSLAGLDPESLPRAPGWDWSKDYGENEAAGHVPRPEVLFVGRAASVLLLAATVVPAWLLGRLVAGTAGAWLFTGLLMLNPLVLLNGRRAMQEGALLFFGLLTILAAFHLARQLAAGRGGRILWVAFGLAAGLTLASKHSGLIFVAGGGAVIVTAALFAPPQTSRLRTGGLLALALAGAAALFVLLSPALWDKPWQRVADAARVRTELVQRIDDGAHTSAGQRTWRIVTMPFMEPLQHFEMADWARTPGLGAAIARYDHSRLAGHPIGGVAGWLATFLAVLGLVVSVAGGWSSSPETTLRRGAAAWWAVSAVLLLGNPLAWQRYYLPLVPPAALLATLGILWITGLVRKKFFRRAPRGA